MDERRRLTRRDFLRLSAAAATGAMVAACAPAAPQVVEVEKQVPVEKVVVQTVEVEKEVVVEKPAKPAERVIIEWWWGWGGMTGMNAMKGVTDAFNMKRQDIYVHSLVPSNMDEKLLTAVAGGTPPDIAVGNIAYSEFCARGALTPLDDYFAASKVIQHDDIIPSLWRDATWQGKTYGLAACEVGPRIGLCYNVDLVKDAGLDSGNLPLTWDEMYDWHQKITTFDAAGNIEILGFDPLDAMGGRRPTSDVSYFWGDSFGFEYWAQDSMTYNWDNDLFVASLATIKKFYDSVGVEKIEGYRSSYGTWTQSPTASFPAGVQALILNGYWTPGELVHSAPERHFSFTWPPNSSERRGIKFQNVGGHPATLPKGSKHPDAAFELLEFLTTPESMDIILQTTGWLGPRLSWLEKVDPSPYPGLDFFLRSVVEADELKPCPLDPICGFVGQQLSIAWDAVNYGEKTPEQAAKDLQQLCTDEIRKQFPDLAG